MSWPTDYILGWSQWILTNGDVVAPSWQLLKDFFVYSGAVPYNTADKPFIDAMNKKMEPVLWGQPRSWCGIMATWIYRKSGVTAQWMFGSITGSIRKVSGSAYLKPGDIAVIQGNKLKSGNYTWHHFIVLQDNGTFVVSIDGNQIYQTIKKVYTHRKSDIIAYYTYSDNPY